MAGTLWQDWGGLGQPHAAGDVGVGGITDPALAMLVALFAAAINGDHAEAWTAACATLPSASPAHPLRNSTTPVADTLELEPTRTVMQERKAAFPLLALHRDGEGTLEPVTMHREQWRQPWLLHYILGPRTGIQTDRKLLGIFPRARNTIAGTVAAGGHPNYESGALQFYGATLAGPHSVGSVKLGACRWGEASFAGSDDNAPTYHAMVMQLQITELCVDNVDQWPQVTGMEMAVSVGDRLELLRDVVLADTDFPGEMYEP